MNRISNYILPLFFICVAMPAQSQDDLDSSPKRIIRSCCAFGSDLNLYGIPFIKMNQITSMEKLSEHKYMGDKSEGVGNIYTKKAGFIDVGHVRDQADWTRHLYMLILSNRENGEFEKELAYEGGKKTLFINVPNDLDSIDCLLIAAKITFDLSLWHELSTWFGASALPMIPERFSSFSIEDVYSNLLGTYIGMEAINNDKPYNEAMTNILYQTLDSLDAVHDESDTRLALEAVREIWWTREKRLPMSGVMLERDIALGKNILPWLVPDETFGSFEPQPLTILENTSKGELLTNYYSLSIDLNHKFPVKELFPDKENRVITQDDFNIMLLRVDHEFKEQKFAISKRNILSPKSIIE